MSDRMGRATEAVCGFRPIVPIVTTGPAGKSPRCGVLATRVGRPDDMFGNDSVSFSGGLLWTMPTSIVRHIAGMR